MQRRLCFDAWCAVLGVDSEFCNVEALVTGIVDNWPDQLLKHRRKFTGKDDLHLFLKTFFADFSPQSTVVSSSAGAATSATWRWVLQGLHHKTVV
jgi:hypothetical protein